MGKPQNTIEIIARLLQLSAGPALIIDAKGRDERYTIALTLDALDTRSLEAMRRFSDLATIRTATTTMGVA